VKATRRSRVAVTDAEHGGALAIVSAARPQAPHFVATLARVGPVNAGEARWPPKGPVPGSPWRPGDEIGLVPL